MRRNIPVVLTLVLVPVLAVVWPLPAHGEPAPTRATFAGAVNKTLPSVVNIYAARRVGQAAATLPGGAPASPYGNDPLLQNLYGNSAPEAPPALRQKIENSLGSGVIVRADGIVVTNLHVIAGAETVKVALGDGREFPAKFLASDEKTDLAILQLQLPANIRLPVAHFGDANTLRAGDVVLALGNPFGIGQSVTMGVVSAVQRSNANLSPYSQFIQTDAAINPGNSGGALIDSTGAVIGINTAIYSRTGATVGIGFATPANLVQTVVNDILKTGSVQRPWLGAEGQAVSPQLAKRLQLPDGAAGGVYLDSIVPGSPAAAAGLQSGDLLLALENNPIDDPAELNERLLSTPNILGHTVTVTILRDGQRQNIPLRLTALPPRTPAAQRTIPGYTPLSGSTVEQLGPALNVEMSLPLASTGVAIVQVAPAPQGVNGFTPPDAPKNGDLLLAINHQKVATVDDVTTILAQSRRKWEITVQRGPRTLTFSN